MTGYETWDATHDQISVAHKARASLGMDARFSHPPSARISLSRPSPLTVLDARSRQAVI
jgi:hypothetical protein